ncbi:MAG: NADH-quinone oxidoreductase subunit NuoK [Alphaproteobacteria bacterium]|nr:NADH-quinone oxidoreductase subunit NuoK [Alphaproteobacteria bacterium]
MEHISLSNYIILANIIFVIGVFGVAANYKNLIRVLVSIELMLLASNISFVAFSSYMSDIKGQIASIIILGIAAAEAAIALAIIVAFYRNKGSIDIKDLKELKG